MNTIYVGADHRGFELKQKVVEWLDATGYTVVDCGNTQLDSTDDYPGFAVKVGERVVEENGIGVRGGEEKALGIVICGSGVGASIAANKVRGVRAAHAINPPEIEHARARDQVNVLSLSADFVTFDQAKTLIELFIQTQVFGFERDARRIQQILDYETHH